MGSMTFPIKLLNNLRFEKIPKRPLKNCSFVQVDSLILIRSVKGTLYTNCGLGRHVHYGMGLWNFSFAIVECLEQLGLLTKEERKTIDAYHAERQKVREAEDFLQEVAKIKRGEEKHDGLKYRIDKKKVKAAWDLLDWYEQRNAVKYRYAPEGLPLKPEPKREL